MQWGDTIPTFASGSVSCTFTAISAAFPPTKCCKGKVSQLITTYIRCGNINYSLGGVVDKQL